MLTIPIHIITNLHKLIRPSLVSVIVLLTVNIINAQQLLPDSLQQKISRSTDPVEKFKALRIAIDFYAGTGNFKDLGYIAKEEFTIAKSLKNDSLLGVAYTDLGLFYDGKSNYNNALESYLKALVLAERMQNPGEIARTSANISLIYIEIKNYPQALIYLRKAESFCLLPEVSRKRPKIIFVVHNNMTESFLEMGKPDSALKYIQLANTENLALKNPTFQAVLLGNFGWVYEKLQENDLAESYYKKGIAFTDSLQAYRFLADHTYHYSNFLLQQGRYPEANAIALKSMHAANQLDYKYGIINAASILRNSFSKLNQQDSAYYYANMELNFRENVYNQQKVNQMQDMTFAEQIRQIEENQKIIELKEQAKTNLEYVAIFIGIITFCIVFLMLSHSIIASPRTMEILGVIGLLITFEFINLFLEPHLSQMTHHSPLLMLLAMVLIAAFLVPCHHYLEKWISNHLLEKHKKRKIAAAHEIIKKHGGHKPEHSIDQ